MRALELNNDPSPKSTSEDMKPSLGSFPGRRLLLKIPKEIESRNTAVLV